MVALPGAAIFVHVTTLTSCVKVTTPTIMETINAFIVVVLTAILPLLLLLLLPVTSTRLDRSSTRFVNVVLDIVVDDDSALLLDVDSFMMSCLMLYNWQNTITMETISFWLLSLLYCFSYLDGGNCIVLLTVRWGHQYVLVSWHPHACTCAGN